MPIQVVERHVHDSTLFDGTASKEMIKQYTEKLKNIFGEGEPKWTSSADKKQHKVPFLKESDIRDRTKLKLNLEKKAKGLWKKANEEKTGFEALTVLVLAVLEIKTADSSKKFLTYAFWNNKGPLKSKVGDATKGAEYHIGRGQESHAEMQMLQFLHFNREYFKPMPVAVAVVGCLKDSSIKPEESATGDNKEARKVKACKDCAVRDKLISFLPFCPVPSQDFINVLRLTSVYSLQNALKRYSLVHSNSDQFPDIEYGEDARKKWLTPPALEEVLKVIGMTEDVEALAYHASILKTEGERDLSKYLYKYSKLVDEKGGASYSTIRWKNDGDRNGVEAEEDVATESEKEPAKEPAKGQELDALVAFLGNRKNKHFPKAWNDKKHDKKLYEMYSINFPHKSCSSEKCLKKTETMPCPKYNAEDGCDGEAFHKGEDGETWLRHFCSTCEQVFQEELEHRAWCPECPVNRMRSKGKEVGERLKEVGEGLKEVEKRLRGNEEKAKKITKSKVETGKPCKKFNEDDNGCGEMEVHDDYGKTESSDQENEEGSAGATAAVASKLEVVDGTATEAQLREDTKDAGAVDREKKGKDDDGKTESPDQENEEGSTGATAVVAAKSDVLGNTTEAKGREDTKDAAAVDSQKKGKDDKTERLLGLPSVQEKKECKNTKASAAVSAVRVSGAENIGESEGNKDATDGKPEE